MPPPNDADLPLDVYLTHLPNGQYEPSDALVDLLVRERSEYHWPAHTTAGESQRIILELEADVTNWLAALNARTAHQIVKDVSRWAGNNADSRAEIENATNAQIAAMQRAISDLCVQGRQAGALDALCDLPGISLVIASKIYRFCMPRVGAAVDRHASYFFNSLPVVDEGRACHFVREWSNSRHTISRLAIYTARNRLTNRTEYLEEYLPRLASIAGQLNDRDALFRCAVTAERRTWVAADVEMAAYYWWARERAG